MAELKMPMPRAWINEKPDPTGGTMRWVSWTRERAENHVGLYTEEQVRVPPSQAPRHMTRVEVQGLARKVGVHDPVTFDAMTRLVNAALGAGTTAPARQVGWLHRQGNHTELSERALDADEISRGWTQEPVYAHGVIPTDEPQA